MEEIFFLLLIVVMIFTFYFSIKKIEEDRKRDIEEHKKGVLNRF